MAGILAGLILSITILPRYIGFEAKSGVRQEEELQEQFLEDLAVSIDNQDNTSTVLTVTNNGDVTAHLVGVSRRYEGRIGTTRLDTRLAPKESKTITIPAGSYDRIGVLTDRGNLYPVKTEPFVLTVLEGTVIDSETEEPVGSSIGGNALSKNIPIELETDEFGEFRVVLPKDLAPGTHQFQFTASSTGYDNKTVVGEIKRGENKRITIELDYNPFDLALNPENSSYTGEWVDNTYENTVVENFTATRRVVAGYRWIYFQKDLSSLSPYCLTHRFEESGWKFRLPDSWREFFDVNKNSPSYHFYYKEFSISSGKAKAIFNYEFRLYGLEAIHVDKSGNITTKKVPDLTSRLPTASWLTSSEKLPDYEEEEYTRYRTTVYEVNDHQFENQGSLQSEVILTPHNGYDNVIRLEIEPENAKAELESTTLTPSSPSSTTLNAETPTGGTHGNRAIGVRACDADGRLVEMCKFRLNIQVPEKPPVEKTVLRTAESDFKPPESGGGAVIYQTLWGGVDGKIEDAHGSPIGNATVRAWEDDTDLGSKSSYGDGRYSFFHIMGARDSKGNYYGVNPSYKYKVYVHKFGYWSDTKYGTWRPEMGDLPVYVDFHLMRKGAPLK